MSKTKLVGRKQSSADEEVVRDVVCGMVKPKSQMEFNTVFEGKTYYFCTEMDKEMFLAHPERWAEQSENLVENS
jgi:YHS domain-containing protein